MGITVFHSLTATTPDNTQYEIRPSHWNSNHLVSLSLAGSDLSNAFSNSPTVTFGTSGGLMTASVNTNYAATNITTNNIATSQSSLFQQTSATSAITSAAFASANSTLLVATSQSSLFQQTSATSAITSAAFASSNSSLLIATSNSSLFQQTSATSAITSAAFPSAQTTKFAGTGTTFAGTNITATIGLNSNGLALSLSGNTGGGGGGGIAAAAGTQTATSGTVVFSNSNGISFGMSNSSVITASYTVPTVPTAYVSSVNGSSGAISLNVGSSLSASTNGSSITFGLASNITTALQSANANYLTSQSNQAFSASGGSSTFQTLNFANSNGVTFSNSNGSVIASVPATSLVSGTGIVSISTNGGTISIGAPAMSVGVSGGNTSGNTGTVSNQFVLAGGNNITLSGSTNAAGMTVTVSANTAAAANLSVSAGTTSGAFGGLTFANSNNVTFGLNNGTITASAPSGGGGGIAAAAGTQTATSGTVVFSNSNGITFGMSNSSVITASYTVPTVPTAYVSSVNGSSGAISLNVGSSLSASTNGSSITFGLASNITTALQSANANYLTSQSNQAFSASGGSSTFQTLNFANSNGVTFSNSGGSVVASVPATSSLTATGAVSISTNGNTISIGAPAFSAGVTTLGNTAGNTGTVSNQLVLVGGNNVTLSGSTAAGGMTLSINASGGGGGGIAAAAGTQTATSGTVVFSNSNGITFGMSNSSVITASYTVPTVPTAYVSSVNGSSGAISLNVGSSLSASTNGSSITFGLASNITTALQSANANYLTSQSNQAFSASGGSSTFQTLNFANSNGVTFSNSGGSVVASYTVPTVPTAYVSSVNGSSGAISLNVGSSLSASTNGSSITFGLASNITTALQSAGAYLTTAAQSSASNVSLIIAGTASNGGTASLSGGVSFSNANGVSFYTSAGNAVVATVRTDYLTTQSAQAFSASGGSSTFQTLNFANSNGVTFSNSGGSVVASVPATSSLSGTGALSISTNGGTISIGVPAFSAGVTTLGNTSGNTGTVSNQLVLAGGNNITLSGSTAAGGMTLTISGPNVGGAQTGISGIIAGTQTQTSGTVSFANSNGITFGMSNSSVITASYTVPTVPTAYVSSVNGSSGAISLNVGSSLSASTNGSSITFGLASNITTALQSANANYLTSQSNQAFSASGGSSTFQTLNFANSNGVTFSNSGGSVVASYTVPTVPTAYVSSVNGSSGAISLNVGSSLSASTNGSSITFGLASNITTALQSAGAYLTTAAQSSASNVSLVIAGTAPGGGTASLSGGVSFSNANGVSFYTSAGNAVVASYTVPTVPTAYVSSVNGSSGAISLNVGSSLSASTNGSSITFGLASNITTALQSANANYLTSQSNQAFSASGGSSTFQTLNFANSNGVTFSNSNGSVVASYTVPTQTNQTVGFYASSQTTGQSSSSTFDARSMSFVGAGGISVGASNGSLIFSGATGGGGGGGVAFANSQTTYTSGTVSLREGGGAITIASNTGQRIDISVPAVSSIYGTNGILISTNGSSISIQNEFNKTWEVAPAFSNVIAISALSANTLNFLPLYPQDNYTFTGMQMIGSMQTATATNASYAVGHTVSYALYSLNQTATTVSRLGSSSLAIIVTASSNARAGFTISYDGANSVTSSSLGTALLTALNGQKYINHLFASSLQDGGAYALAIAYSSSTTNAAPLAALSYGGMRFGGGINAFGFLDGTSANGTANSCIPDGYPFFYSATSGAWPSTIPFSDRRQAGYQFPYIMFRGT